MMMAPGFRKFWLGVILGLLFAAVSQIPSFLMPWVSRLHGAPFVPILRDALTTYSKDEAYYIAIASEVYDGNGPQDSLLYEYQNELMSSRWVVPCLRGRSLAFFKGNLLTAFTVADFIFDFLQFQLLFLFLLTLTRRVSLSALTALLALIFSPLVGMLPFRHLMNDLKLFGDLFWNFNAVGLADLGINSEFAIFLLAILLATWARVRHSVSLWVLVGLSGGLLAYTYPYFCFIFWVGLSLLGLWDVVRGDFPKMRRFVLAAAVGGCIALPYLARALAYVRRPYLEDVFSRLSLEPGHFLEKFLTLKYLIFLLLFLWVVGSRRTRTGPMVLCSFFVAGLLGINLQLFTGRATLSENWEDVFQFPWAVTMSAVCLAPWFRRKRWLSNVTWGLVAMTFAYVGVQETRLSLGVRYSFEKFRKTAPIFSALTWLDANSPKGQVVLILDPELSILVPVYTNKYTYAIASNSARCSNEELWERFGIGCALFGLSGHDFEEILKDISPKYTYFNHHVRDARFKRFYKESPWAFTLFAHKYLYGRRKMPPVEEVEATQRILKGEMVFLIPQKEIAKRVEDYRRILGGIDQVYKRYHLDYVISIPWAPVSSKALKATGSASRIYSKDGVEIFALNSRAEGS